MWLLWTMELIELSTASRKISPTVGGYNELFKILSSRCSTKNGERRYRSDFSRMNADTDHRLYNYGSISMKRASQFVATSSRRKTKEIQRLFPRLGAEIVSGNVVTLLLAFRSVVRDIWYERERIMARKQSYAFRHRYLLNVEKYYRRFC